jgi:uncharacterized protein YozE (UPF0346 family)
MLAANVVYDEKFPCNDNNYGVLTHKLTTMEHYSFS